jgi:hypothetical protein
MGMSAKRRSFFNAPSGWVGVKLARASNRVEFLLTKRKISPKTSSKADKAPDNNEG